MGECDDVCAVCFDGDVQEGNDIILCETCDLEVHLFCYGLPNVPEGDWFCSVCEAKTSSENDTAASMSPLVCCICRHSGGAMKPTNCGQWAHVHCALHISEIQYERGDETIDVAALPPSDRRHQCMLCSVNGGSTLRCDSLGCSNVFHVSCAMVDNAARAASMKTHPYDDQAPSEPYCDSFLGTQAGQYGDDVGARRTGLCT